MKQEENKFKFIFEEWDRRVRRAIEVHYESSKKLQHHHQVLGIIALINVTILGASKDLKIEGDYSWICSVFFYLISLTAATLVGLQTFLKFGERAEKHKEVASSYAALRRKIEHLAYKSFESKEILDGYINDLTKEWDDLSKSSPAANSNIWSKYENKYDSKNWKSNLYQKS